MALKLTPARLATLKAIDEHRVYARGAADYEYVGRDSVDVTTMMLLLDVAGLARLDRRDLFWVLTEAGREVLANQKED